MNIVLLGGTGYIGSALIKQFATYFPAGEIKVRALIRKNKKHDFDKYPFLEFIEGELPNSIPSSLFPEEPHIVFHFATKQIDTDGSGFQINVEGTKMLLDKLPSTTQCIIFGSSLSVYGQNSQEGVTESTPIAPGTPLAKTRAQAEELIFDWARRFKKNAIILRPRFIIGNTDKFVLPTLINLIRKNIVIGNGQQAFSVIDVDDYAKIIIRLAETIERLQNTTQLCRAFNIGYEKPLLLSEINEEICNVLKLEKPKIHIPIFPLFLQLMRICPIKKIRDLAIQLELIRVSHYGAVDALRSIIGPDIIERNPREILSSILRDHKFNINIKKK